MYQNVLLIMLLFVASCVREDLTHEQRPDSEMIFGTFPKDAFRPKAYRYQLRSNIPSDPDSSYANGYRAGCQTMNSAVGEGLYRIRGPKIDPDKLSSDSWYLRGYNDGSAACFHTLDWDLH